LRALRIRPPLRGTWTVYPNIPCTPGNVPVVSVAKEVAVVDGKDVWIVAKFVSLEIAGIASPYFSITSAPKPSIRNKSSRPLGDGPTLKWSSAVVSPKDEKIDGVIWDKCTFISSHYIG
jgi:hypothetical protein